jgi:molybdenum cofactor biosynthesis enzyme MoaA
VIPYESIRKVHLEISTRCNASCPLCPRNLAGYDMDLGFPLHSMTLSEAKTIFDELFLRQLHKILINGNFGDFVTAKDGPEIVQYFFSVNPNIHIEISTNASARPNIWTKLAQYKNLKIGFDIDGLADTHSLYRRNTDWNLVIENAKSFIAAGGNASWRMIVFEHNKHQVEACRQLSIDLKFKKFEIINDGRDSGPVYDKNGNFQYRIGKDPHFQHVDYPSTATVWQSWTSYKHKKKIWPIEPTTKEKICHAKKENEIYLTATGEVYPCCWLGFYPHSKFEREHFSDDELLKQIVKNNNANFVGMKKAIEYFNEIESAWEKDLYSQGRIFTCDHYCGKKQ